MANQEREILQNLNILVYINQVIKMQIANQQQDSLFHSKQFQSKINEQCMKVQKSMHKKSIISKIEKNSQRYRTSNIGVLSSIQSSQTITYIYDQNPDDKLGQGSYGAVYKCYTQVQGIIHRFALKVIKIPSTVGHSIQALQDILFTTRQQIQTLVQFKYNPNIIKIQDIVRENNIIYMILQYCNQKDLISYMQQLRTTYGVNLDLQFLNKKFSQILNGFKPLYEKIIHRDIKPGNILVHNNRLKIGDFGLSTKIHSIHQQHTSYVGTICSAAPQIRFRQGTYTSKCDIFSLGVVYYWMIYGHYPYKDHMEKQDYLEYQIQFNDFGVDDDFIVTDDVKKLIRSMLAYDQAKRPDWNDLFNHPFFKSSLDKLQSQSARGTILGRSLKYMKSGQFNQLIPEQLHKYIKYDGYRDNRISNIQFNDFLYFARSIRVFKLRIGFFKVLMKQLADHVVRENTQFKIQEQILGQVIRLGIQKYTLYLSNKLKGQLNFSLLPQIIDKTILQSLKRKQQFTDYAKDITNEIQQWQSQQLRANSKRESVIKSCHQYQIENEFINILSQNPLNQTTLNDLLAQITKVIIQFIYLIKPQIKNCNASKTMIRTSHDKGKFYQLILLVHHLNIFVMEQNIFCTQSINDQNKQNLNYIDMEFGEFIKKETFQNDIQGFQVLSKQIMTMLEQRFQQ